MNKIIPEILVSRSNGFLQQLHNMLADTVIMQNTGRFTITSLIILVKILVKDSCLSLRSLLIFVTEKRN